MDFVKFDRTLSENVAKADALDLLGLGHDPVAGMRGRGARNPISVICGNTSLFEHRQGLQTVRIF